MPQSKQWYVANTGNHQGLIIDNVTGKNIAVTYDKQDAPAIVRAVNCFDELVEALSFLLENFNSEKQSAEAIVKANAILNKANQT